MESRLLIVAVLCVLPLAVLSHPGATSGGSCPFAAGVGSSVGAYGIPSSNYVYWDADEAQEHMDSVEELNWVSVKNDIKKVLNTSQEWWPSDNGHYGGLMIRLAWHCAGSYRISDGHGGCDGGRQRFDPERSWDDNTNLDKARKLLQSVKLKYGNALSWGDLIILAGTVAIEDMGGPTLGFCAGRVDDIDGSDSTLLGPSVEQAVDYPCAVNGECSSPLGPTTIGLIYVNPEGPMGQPKPTESSSQVRDTFARMAMNDAETVALIGGGHAFGKTHGACDKGPGPKPSEDPLNPWPGMCGTGKGADTFTSGFEGPWTTTPTKWSNQYFHQLLNNVWEVHTGSGGHFQWKSNTTSTMMLTSDISLLNDPQGSYQKYVKLYAENLTAFEDAFKHAWYKLVTRDMGPISRCLGPNTASAQAFQYPLPSPPSKLADFESVRTEVKKIMTTSSATIDGDYYQGEISYGALFVQLAFQSSATFRRTDYIGGANGGRIRFAPQSNWPVNVGMDKVLELLKPVKEKFGDSLPWADLIVAAGQIAIEANGGNKMKWCGGRSDATSDDGASDQLIAPWNMSITPHVSRQRQSFIGLTSHEWVALQARPRSALHQSRLGYNGTWSVDPRGVLSNQYFITLITEKWTPMQLPNGHIQYKADGKDLFMTPSDINILYDAEWLAIAQEYAQSDNSYFLRRFASAWTRLVSLDRFDGPLGNVCFDDSEDSSSSSMAWYLIAIISVAGTLAFTTLVYCCCLRGKNGSSINTDGRDPLIHH